MGLVFPEQRRSGVNESIRHRRAFNRSAPNQVEANDRPNPEPAHGEHFSSGQTPWVAPAARPLEASRPPKN